MTICTIDVHSRDVVNKFIQCKLETASAFQWQSQLRHRWDDDESDCFANICDAQFRYSHEYLGNTPRLVITPLTDRCYITLTQSLHLVMGGGPAGKYYLVLIENRRRVKNVKIQYLCVSLRSCWNWKNGNYERFRTSIRHHGVRI